MVLPRNDIHYSIIIFMVGCVPVSSRASLLTRTQVSVSSWILNKRILPANMDGLLRLGGGLPGMGQVCIHSTSPLQRTRPTFYFGLNMYLSLSWFLPFIGASGWPCNGHC